MSRQAKTITDQQLADLLGSLVATSREPLRDYAIILLSFKAGLRAAEIAGLEWRDVLDAAGKVGQVIGKDEEGQDVIGFTVPKSIAKKGHTRTIPLHPALQAALEHLGKHRFSGRRPTGRVITGLMSSAIDPDALRKYIARTFRKHGLDCTSHSGRRTMITKMARIHNQHACSLKDVQKIAGHKFIDTTERYVELSPSAAKLVRAI